MQENFERLKDSNYVSQDNIIPFDKFKSKRAEERAKYDIIGLIISKFIPDWLERDFSDVSEHGIDGDIIKLDN